MSGASGAGGSVRRAYIAYRRLRQFAVTAVFLSLAGGAAAEEAGDVRKDIAYGPLPMQQGDLYLPASPAEHRPAVIAIHGGGWVGGSRDFDAGLSALLAAQGVAVFNIDYRLAAADKPDTHWPAQLVDAQLAVRFLRAHASEYGIDPARFGAIGDSAGAQLAVFLGVLPRTVAAPGSELYADQRPDVMAVVDQFGPVDLPAMGNAATGSILALFGTATPTGAALQTASPLPAVTGHSAPVYILHGTDDPLVPFQQSRQLADTLKANGVAFEFVSFPGGHEYDGLPPGEADKLQLAAVKWLVERLKD